MADLSPVRGLAFDLDGTLIDSAKGLATALDSALQAAGLPAAGEDSVAAWIGNGADVLVERALHWAEAELTPELHRQVRTRFDHDYAQEMVRGSALFPQVRATLARLAEAGLPLGLITNKPTPFVAPLLEGLEIAHYFTRVIGGDDVVVKKPHPAPLYLLLGQLGLYAHELLFIGDSRNDILAARAAGCPSVGLTYGYNHGEAIALSRPTLVLERFADLLPALGLPSLENQDIST